MKQIILITTLLFSFNLLADDSITKRPHHKNTKEICSCHNDKHQPLKHRPHNKRKNQHPPKKDIGSKN